MYESPSTIPRSGAERSGSGPRRPQELVVGDALDDDRRGILHGFLQPGAVGNEKERERYLLDDDVGQPDRPDVRSQPIRPSGVVADKHL